MGTLHKIETSSLRIAYEAHGPDDGPPAILLHGFPYAPRTYDAVAPALAGQGLCVIVPYLRGYGPTRFLDDSIPRSGEQAALGKDLIELVETLGLKKPVLAGYDWGGRAACITAAIRPDLVGGLVTGGGYNLMGPPTLGPVDPAIEHMLWYQYYLHTHRGRMMLVKDRRAFCRYLWKIWSPRWEFDDETFEMSAACFDNPDFVEVVLHSYRHRAGLVPGDPALGDLARRLETRPDITVPTIALHGDSGPALLSTSRDREMFTGPYEHKVLPGIGHNIPQEAPRSMIEAVSAMIRTV